MVSKPPVFRFAGIVLDVSNRQLWRGGRPLDLTARYFDALALLVREHGQLVEKDRFFSEIREDVVVTEGALTQCIKDIRKQLGDGQLLELGTHEELMAARGLYAELFEMQAQGYQ